MELGGSAPPSCSLRVLGDSLCDRCMSEGVCGDEALHRLGWTLQGLEVLGKGFSYEHQKCSVVQGVGLDKSTVSWLEVVVSGRQGADRCSEQQWTWGRDQGRWGLECSRCSWGMWGSLGKDGQSPLILFWARMLIPAPPCFLLLPPASSRPSGGALWSLLFAWFPLVFPVLGMPCSPLE